MYKPKNIKLELFLDLHRLVMSLLKKLIKPLLLCLLTITVLAQERHKGFVYIGPAGYQAVKGGNAMFGGAMGFGAYKGLGSLGIGIEALSQKKDLLIPVYADLRIHFKNSASSPFVLLQPGYILAKNEISSVNTGSGVIKTTQHGDLYLAGGVGFTSLVNKTGITAQLKFAMISNKITTSGAGTKQTSVYARPGYVGVSFGVAF